MDFGNTTDLRIQQIKRYVTIFDVLREFGVEYPQEATQQVRCPFHEDRSPSARIYADQNKVFCFTEARSWDQIDAVETLRQCNRPDALTWLEQTFGVPGLTQTLQGVIRSQLASRIPPDAKQTTELVETRLRQERQRLGFVRYTKLLMALDLSVWEYSERKVNPTQFADRMVQLLSAARS
jgi:hypothetical protein